MNRFSRAGLLLSLSIIIVCIVAFLKGSTSGYIPIVLVLTIIIIIPVSIGMAIGNSIRKKTDASFRKTLDRSSDSSSTHSLTPIRIGIP